MGVALVNLVWRRLAVKPSVLQWSWQTLKPHYISGVIPEAAWLLRAQLDLPAVDSLDTTEYEGLHNDLNDASIIDDVLRTYERGNAQNLIALCHLQLCLNSADGNAGSGVSRPSIARLDINQCALQRTDAEFGAIPKLPLVGDLPENNQSLVDRASRLWIPDQYKELTPSVFRHLSYWPDLLRVFADRLEEMDRVSDQSINSIATHALGHATGYASTLNTDIAQLPELDIADRRWLCEVLDAFIEGMLARGVVIVPILRKLLASASSSWTAKQ